MTKRKGRAKSISKNILNTTTIDKKTNKKISKNKPEIIKNKNYNKKINELEKENNNLKEEINKLKKELHDKDKIIKKQKAKIKEQINTINELKTNKNKFNKLVGEIKDLISVIPFDVWPGEKIISIIFKSVEENILYPVLCQRSDKFTRLKNIIYDKYPEYKEYENYFLFNGEKINENETLKENKINDGSIIIIYSN